MAQAGPAHLVGYDRCTRAMPAVHRAAAAGPPVYEPGVETLAIQLHLSELPAEPAVVARRDHGCGGRLAASRAGHRVRDAAVARCFLTCQLRCDEPRSP